MKAPEATAVHKATARPAQPIARKAAIGRPRLETTTNAPSARQAKTARPATWVVVSTESSRWSTPALDQTTAAAATKSSPRWRAASPRSPEPSPQQSTVPEPSAPGRSASLLTSTSCLSTRAKQPRWEPLPVASQA